MIIPNIDWITVSFDFDCYDEVAKEVIEVLKAAKEQSKEKQDSATNEKEQIAIDNIVFAVYPNGSRTHAFIIENDDYKISIAEFRSKKENIYPVSAIIHSKSLWSYSPLVTYTRLSCLINNVFGVVKSNKISRMDLCCHTDILDFAGVSIHDFRSRINKKDIRINNNEINGFIFGTSSGALKCRIYNKTIEVKEKNNKTWFFDIWSAAGANGAVWNVEFELHREFFRNYGIDTVEQAFERIGSIWEYCMDSWLVLTDNDRTRLENCTTNSDWLRLAAAFEKYAHEPLIRREEQNNMDGDALIPAWTGYTTSIAALLEMDDIETAIEVLKDKGREYLWKSRQKTYTEEINEKSNLLREK